MKILHIFIRDLGGEFAAGSLLEAAASLGEMVPERTSTLYSEYFVASGLAPVRARLRRENIIIAGERAMLEVNLKLYSYGVVLLEYAIEPLEEPSSPSTLFQARTIELPGPRHVEINALRKEDFEQVTKVLTRWLNRSYEIPNFLDQMHLFIDSSSRSEEDVMEILLPGDESYPIPIRRRISKHIDLCEEGERFYVMGNRAYLYTSLDPWDLINFLELSRVQLYELKVYDYMLDRGIENTYNFLDQLPRQDQILPLAWLRSDFKNQVRQVLQLTEIRMDLVDVVKDITNTTKVTEDPYFELVYRQLNEIFHVGEWFTSVRDKIDELEDVQRMILSRVDIFKSTTLEMTIIILILIEVLVPAWNYLYALWK